MYRAKRGGADRIEIFRPEFRQQEDDRVTIERDLRVAIDKGQLFVLYQPIISLATEELAGFEALVRWQHPRMGLVSPDAFVPVAEESDLIVRLGSFVLARAAEDAARWQKMLPRADKPVFVSVNVSSRQLFRQDLVQEVRQVLARTVLPAGALRLEVTESLVMDNPEAAAETLEQLRGAGIGLAMDDFGTGYSSLSYLHRFPFDTIKIDRDLVMAGGREASGSAIVRSIVALSHELGKKVVAEGVEEESDVGFLRSINCEMAQGFYYGEPSPARDVENMLRAIRKSENRLRRRGFFRTTTMRKAGPERKPRPTNAPAADANGAAARSGTMRRRPRHAQPPPPPPAAERPPSAPPPFNGSTPGAAGGGSAPPAMPPPPSTPNAGMPNGLPPGMSASACRTTSPAIGSAQPPTYPTGMNGAGAHRHRCPATAMAMALPTATVPSVPCRRRIRRSLGRCRPAALRRQPICRRCRRRWPAAWPSWPM